MSAHGPPESGVQHAEMLRLLAESVQDYAVFLMDPHGRVLSWSHGAEQLLGYHADEVIGRPADLFFTPEDRQAGIPRQELEQARAGGRGADDHWHVRKDGSRFWSGVAVTPLRDGDGTLRGFAKIMRDRTALKRAQEILHEQESLLDLAPVLVRDLNDRIIRWTRGMEHLYGWTQDEAVGRVSHDLLRTRFPEPLPDIRARLLRAGRWEGELTHARRDGRTVVVASQWVVHRDGVGRPVAILEVNNDVTGQKRAAEAVRRSEERIVATLESLTDGFLRLDRDWRIVYVNPELERQCQRPRADQLGKVFWDEWPATLGTTLEAEFRRAAAERVTIEFDNYYAQFDRWFHLKADPTSDGGLAVFSRDVTEPKRADQALRESETRFRTLADSIPQLAWTARPDGYIVWYNRRWYEYTGTTPAQMEGWGWQSVHDPDALPKVLERWQASIASGEPFDMVFPLKGRTGASARS